MKENKVQAARASGGACYARYAAIGPSYFGLGYDEDFGNVQAANKANVGYVCKNLQLMARMPKDNQLLNFLESLGVPGIADVKSECKTKITEKVAHISDVATMLYHAGNYLFLTS